MSKTIQLNIPITKIDEEQRIVTGIATSEALDSQGDIVDYEASKKAFGDWQAIGNIREMHDPVAIGKAIDVQFDDATKQVIVSARISESADGENAWTKVKEGVLGGFSIGGRVFEVIKDKAVEGANRVMDYSLSELSLVDNPACPDARLLMVKSVDGVASTTEIVTDYVSEALKLAEQFITAKEQEIMAEKKELEKTNVVAGEERDLNAEVVVTAEEAGRPVDDTSERAAAVADKADEAKAEEPEEEKSEAVAEAAEAEAPAEADKPGDVVEPEVKADEAKADSATDLVKSVETLLAKLEKGQSVELKKAFGDIQKSVGEVAASVDALKDRVATLENQPLPTKAQRYQVVSKGDEGEVKEEVNALLKRQEELVANPHDAKPGEMLDLAMKLRKANLGEQIKIN